MKINPEEEYRVFEILSYDFGYTKTVIYNFTKEEPSKEYKTSIVFGPLGEFSLSTFIMFILILNVAIIAFLKLRKRRSMRSKSSHFLLD